MWVGEICGCVLRCVAICLFLGVALALRFVAFFLFDFKRGGTLGCWLMFSGLFMEGCCCLGFWFAFLC